MRTLFLLLALVSLAQATTVAPPYWGVSNPSGGTVTASLSGVLNVAASSGTADSPTGQLNGIGGTMSYTDKRIVDVKVYGAKGDGTTDDTAAIQAAITAAGAGSAIFISRPTSYYKIATGPINVNKSLMIYGYQSMLKLSTHTAIFNVTASSVVIQDLYLVGTGSTLDNTTLETGINIAGASAAAPVTNVQIINNTLDSFEFYGINARWLTDFTMSGNRISNIWYAGIGCSSCLRGNVFGNTIKNVVGTPNAYGIFMSVNNPGVNYTLDPRSSDVNIFGNVISSVPYWEGLDTHLGQRLTFANNTVTGAMLGIQVGGANGTQDAPIDITVNGNMVDSGNLITHSYGIAFTGGSPIYCSTCAQATGIISNNIVKNYGDTGNDHSGAIYMHGTEGVNVIGNRISSATDNAILLYFNNFGTNVIGNTIVDPLLNGVYLENDFNFKIQIADNLFSTRTTSAWNAIKLAASANVDASVGPNLSGAATYLLDGGSHARAMGWSMVNGYTTEISGPTTIEQQALGLGSAQLGATFNVEGTVAFDNQQGSLSSNDLFVSIASKAGRQAGLLLRDGSTTIFEVYKSTDNTFHIQDQRGGGLDTLQSTIQSNWIMPYGLSVGTETVRTTLSIGTMTVSGVTAPPNGAALCLSGGQLGHCTTTPTNGACSCTAP